MTETRVLRGDRCQCAACGEYFNSTYAFDKHRKGRHDASRYCVEPRSIRMVKNDAGYWISAANKSWSLDDAEE